MHAQQSLLSWQLQVISMTMLTDVCKCQTSWNWMQEGGKLWLDKHACSHRTSSSICHEGTQLPHLWEPPLAIFHLTTETLQLLKHNSIATMLMLFWMKSTTKLQMLFWMKSTTMLQISKNQNWTSRLASKAAKEQKTTNEKILKAMLKCKQEKASCIIGCKVFQALVKIQTPDSVYS